MGIITGTIIVREKGVNMRFRHVGALIAGSAIDAVLGDPAGWPHPVRLIGKQIDFGEELVRERILTLVGNENWPFNEEETERVAGVALSAGVMFCAPAATWAVLKIAQRVHPALAFGVETLLFYQLVATRALRDESMAVCKPLKQGDTEAARTAVARIVGRDTENLDEAGIARAAVETIAENASDGVIAPMMYQAVGGAPLTMLYKAVNTLDSMVGYKNKRYVNLGRASALIDDAFNVVPARATGLAMCVAAHLPGFDAERAWAVFKRDRYNHTSPNSAQAEAACAGALGLQLGGPNYYGGKLINKPTIGDDTREVEAEDIVRANHLLFATAAVGLAACVVLGLLSGLANGKKK